MSKSRTALAASVLVGASAVAFAVSGGTATADSVAVLPLTTFQDVVVDGVHKRVFVSDEAAGKIVATDYRGKVLAEITGLPRVSDLALSSDSSRLYAAAGREIVAVATDRLTVAKRYAVGDRSAYHLAPAGEQLWFGYLEGDDGHVGRLNLADSSLHLPTGIPAERLQGAPVVHTSTTAPGTVVVSDVDNRDLWVYDVSAGTETELQQSVGSLGTRVWSDFTLDGSALVRVSDRDVSRVRLSDLTTTVTYPALARANGVDVAADGRTAISVASQASGDDIYVFRGDETTAAQTIRLPRPSGPPIDGSGRLNSEGVQDGGIAWEPNGPRLFAVTRYNGAFQLRILNEPATPTTTPPKPPVLRETPTLILTRNGSVHDYGSTVSVIAHLGAADTNRTVEIWADPYGPEANRLVKKGSVDRDGNLTASFRLTRNTKFTARFTGDARYTARSVTSLLLTRVKVSTTVAKHYKTGKIGSKKYFFFRKKATPRFTTTMTSYAGRKQRLVVEYYADGRWRNWSVKDVALDSRGVSIAKFSGKHRLNVKFRVRAAYLKGLTEQDSVNYTTHGTWKYFTFRK
ncbi:hypothetical protein AB0F81_00375 [Actinoplanes sp. NPDC024001]|uniref:hypothetical protein n=1 Tax=Actinoplanes sp. NPDC024001 TaxID=3154598 RepID=UPI0033D2963B